MIFKITCMSIIFLSILITIYLYISLKNEKYIDKMIEKYEIRKEKRREKEKLGFIDKVDIIKENLNLNIYTEILIVIFLCISFLMFYISKKFTNIFVINMGVSTLTFMTCYFVLKEIYKPKVNSLDKETIIFANIMLNMIETNDDIVQIITKSIPFLNGNIKNYCTKFVVESKNIGLEKAFLNFSERAYSKRLKILVNNLRIASKHKRNYQEVIEGSKDIFLSYFELKEDRNRQILSGRIEILILMGIGMGIFYMLTGIIPNMVQVLTSTSTGNKIILYFVFVINYTWISIIRLDNFDY